MRTVTLLVLIACVLPLRSQLLSPYTAAEGVQIALRTATQNGIVNARVDGIYTTGDTALLASLGGAIGQSLSLNFSFSQGTNTLWLYSVGGQTADLRDTAIIYAAVKIFTIFQAFPLFGIPGLGQLSQMRGESALPNTFMNSDVMVRKLAADSVFRAYRQQYPRSILLGASLASIRQFSATEPAPWWSVLIGEGSLAQPGAGALTCFVPATDTSGQAVCFAAPVSSTDDWQSHDQLSLYPNPADQVAFLRLPPGSPASHLTIEICTLRGDVVASYWFSALGADNAIALPVSSLASGAYLVRYRTPSSHQVLPLVISR